MKVRKGNRTRRVVQLSFLLLVLAIATGKTLANKGIVLPFLLNVSLHAVCPFGGVETIYTYFSTGDLLRKIHSASVILMLIVLVTAVLFGPIFCGYICPFGTVQEWIGKIGKRFFSSKYNHFIPQKLDRGMRYLRYVVLALVLYQTAAAGKLIFQNVDPYYALFNFFTDEVAISAYLVLGVIVILSLFVERPWCKYACPYGALLGIFNKVRIFPIRRNKNTCVGCKQCDRACPMNIAVSDTEVVRDHQCISCHECTSAVACPIKETVYIGLKEEGNNHED